MCEKAAEYKSRWSVGWPPHGARITQVYGILFDNSDHVLVLRDGDRYNLPGGKPENQETWLETLERECMEEAQVELEGAALLGYVQVDLIGGSDADRFYQLRFVAKLRAIHPSAPDPSTDRAYEREYLPAEEAATCLKWGEHGQHQMSDAEKLWKAVVSAHWTAPSPK